MKITYNITRNILTKLSRFNYPKSISTRVPFRYFLCHEPFNSAAGISQLLNSLEQVVAFFIGRQDGDK